MAPATETSSLPPSVHSATRRSKRKAAQKPLPAEIPDADLTEEAKPKKTRASAKKPKKSAAKVDEITDIDAEEVLMEEESEEGKQEHYLGEIAAAKKKKTGVAVKKAGDGEDGEADDSCFIGDPVPEEEARRRWPHRYPETNAGNRISITQKKDDDIMLKAKCHYWQAKVDDIVYNLHDCAYVVAGEGEKDYICRIVEFFSTYDNELYFTARWFFRAEDTVIGTLATCHDSRRVFLSDETNDNALNCITKKIQIVHVSPEVGSAVNENAIVGSDLYYDMSFNVAYSSFSCLQSGVDVIESSTTSTSSTTSNVHGELSLLDLYSGCGAMSTGLCLGANLAGVNLKTRWAVDMNSYACESLRFNHPEAEVRNEKAEDFLALLHEWERLVETYCVESETPCSDGSDIEDPEEQSNVASGEFEVGKFVGICYGKTENLDKDGLKFKVRWKGYGSSEDTWEPVDGLSNCTDSIRSFVTYGYKKNILPLPGKVDVICGGPPCQGISGFNRFRQTEDPFKDEKNKQMAVFMDFVKFLKPKYVLMENVVDILKFAKGYLGRYALSQLVSMRYQAKLGILAAGSYGLPQYRMRVFLWGAQPTQKLPQFPLPTHEVITRGGSPVEFETHVVAFDGCLQKNLQKALLLADAISDLPPVENDESRDEMGYVDPPKTDFQRFIRLRREEMLNQIIYDHIPLQLNEDDHGRVCQIPKHKGANFRNLPGVVVGPDNVARLDTAVPRALLPSGKPLVPDYALSYINGKSPKPFGRLWWDETVPTVVTRAEPHNQIIIHPEQDRVLSVRENARLQGFPDYYKLIGPVKQRYIQVGNAVAVPVSRALGYGLGLAYLGKGDHEPVFALPQNYPVKL
ncbi:uncharacterized protein A4U43_C01F16350 [Asparagus officinalis]|uniref:Cytosine-specific methyltransferase n=1 Tax=Asparagus officinalis TaxID=4686 RepID=A0A5P1FUH2_ASPOF|nr:DNA (cytosine-5)-methyltransferase CMT3-like [Asparagus officinalis]ONK80320.1 uncharacterized protein A4U43_C01F16350 [Asparagus officinalis]